MNSCNDSSNDSMDTTATATTTTGTTTNNQHYQQSNRLSTSAAAGAAAATLGTVVGGGSVGGDIVIAAAAGSGAIVAGNDFDYLNNDMNVGNLPVKSQERYVWEMRTRSPNLTPASTVLNSPDLNTDSMQYTLHHGTHQLSLHHQQHHQQQQQYQHMHQRQHHTQHHHPHHQIRVGHSPGSQFEQHDILPQGLASPGSPTDVGKGDGQCLRDGEIVVFDDIDTNWMSKASANGYGKETVCGGATPTTPSTPPMYHQHYLHHHHQQQQHQHTAEDVLKVTKMIGQLPIAEYEGSPRRFGNQPLAAKSGSATLNATLPKRPPGFPQRVSPTAVQSQTQQHQQQQQQKRYFVTGATSNSNNNNDSDDNNKSSIGNLIDLLDHEEHHSNEALRQAAAAAAAATAVLGNTSASAAAVAAAGSGPGPGDASNKTPTFDYLYEFSETRKVLEEFFKANADDEKRFTDFTESGDDVASSDTQHDYVSEEKHIEQAYIGQRLARIPKDELYLVHRGSPKKQPPSDHNSSSVAYNSVEHNDIELYIDSNSRSSGDLADTELEANLRRHSRNFTLSPETTDYDSNCGDLDSLSNDINCTTDYGKLYTSMPVLEDGLSSGHASDTENNASAVCDKQQQQQLQQQPPEPYCIDYEQNDDEMQHQHQHQHQQQQQQQHNDYNVSLGLVSGECVANGLLSDLAGVDANEIEQATQQHNQQQQQLQLELELEQQQQQHPELDDCNELGSDDCSNQHHQQQLDEVTSHYGAVYAVNCAKQSPPPPPAPVPHRPFTGSQSHLQQQQQQQQQQRTVESVEIQEAMKEIRSALQRAKTQPEKLKFCDEVLPPDPDSPVWVPRKTASTMQQAVAVATAVVAAAQAADHPTSMHTQRTSLHCTAAGANSASAGSNLGDEEELDTDLETDRLLGQQRLDEQDFFDDKNAWQKATRIGIGIGIDACEQTNADFAMLNSNNNAAAANGNNNNNSAIGGNCVAGNTAASNGLKPQTYSTATIRHGIGTALTPNSPDICQIVGNADVTLASPEKLQYTKSPTGSLKSLKDLANSDKKAKTSRNKEGLLEPKVLIEGVLFRARYLGSTQLVCEGQPTKSTRMMQAEEAVSRIKAPEGESQPSTEVDLFISTEKIMVLNTDLKEIMMDHALRTISYIADIGDLVVLMARRRFVPNGSNSSTVGGIATSGCGADGCSSDTDVNGGGSGKENKENIGNVGKLNRTPKMICHVFESDEAQFIAQSIGQAFQVAYMEFLKANGIENESLAKEMDYQEVLNSQEIFGDELEIFAKKELQKEVVVPKAKGEILGVVIVESGWGSMLPTVVIANLMSGGAAARCGQLNIGDQLIAINGMSLVGLPLSTCQSYIRNAKNQTAVKFTVVPCPPVVEVKILRPKALFQLGFSVQNGVICSLLRGGIAERGGVRVGHRIIEINNQSVVAVPHDTIVKLLSSSVGEILMKTMPTSMFRLLTGQETPIYI